jgi:hypothetical protein
MVLEPLSDELFEVVGPHQPHLDRDRLKVRVRVGIRNIGLGLGLGLESEHTSIGA